MLKPGETIHFQTGYDNDGSPQFHRFVALTPPVPPKNKLMLANFSTYKGLKFQDSTSVFSEEEIDFLTDESFIVYDSMQIISEEDIKKRIENQTARIDGNSISKEQLEKIQGGINGSPRTPRGMVMFFNDYKKSIV